MGRRAWIVASSEFVFHRVHLEGVYATASRASGTSISAAFGVQARRAGWLR